MSTIILHDKTNNNWSSLGIGPLKDAINPLATREKNGIYDLSFQYPVTGPLFKELKVGRWFVSNAGPTIQAQSQRFEIAQITKPTNGIVTVYGEHYRYKLLRTIVKIGSKFSNIPAQTALNQLKDRMEPKGEFTFFSDVLTKSSIDFTDPAKFKNAQEVLGGVQGSILDNFGGEYRFNNNEVQLLNRAGIDTNIIIAYGKNLTDIQQEESIENTYTSVYGWAKTGNGDDEKILTLPETFIDSEYVGNYTERRIQMVDFSDKEPKDVTALRNLIRSYIKTNNVGIPKVSIKTSFVDLASAVMDDQLKNLEQLDLCDWVNVAFNQLDINTSAQVIKTVWNVALDQYESIELGEARTDFSKVLEDSKTDTTAINTHLSELEKAKNEASNILKNPGVGHVVIYPSLADPQEILIMDTTDINTAKKVWRWNAGGLGFSSTGYNGSYGLAMTNNGAIVADRITTGTLKAINIIGVSVKGSTIEGSTFLSRNDNGSLFIEGGEITLQDELNRTFANIYSGKTIVGNKTVPLLGIISPGGSTVVSSGKRGGYNYAYISMPSSIDTSNFEIATGNSDIVLATEKNGSRSTRLWLTGSTTKIEFSNLDMSGNSIINESDIRLKENICPTSVHGIEEFKKFNFVDFAYKKEYNSITETLNHSRQTGLIAQYTPFLAKQNEETTYQFIDYSKLYMTNAIATKELIEKVEYLENRINNRKLNKRKYHRQGG